MREITSKQGNLKLKEVFLMVDRERKERVKRKKMEIEIENAIRQEEETLGGSVKLIQVFPKDEFEP
jgi:hypothetical protein